MAAERGVKIRPARAGERVAVLRVLDAAMLTTDADALAERIAAGRVLVAVAPATGSDTEATDERVVGAIEVGERKGKRSDERYEASDDARSDAGGVGGDAERMTGDAGRVSDDADGGHIEAIAVQRRRRGQGIGSALIAAAAERWRPLSADLDADVRPFYENAGFEITVREEDGRYRGRLR